MATLPTLPQDWQEEASLAIISRGKAYYKSGLVKPGSPTDSPAQCFIVEGTEPYQVQLHPHNLYLNRCTCPHADSVSICKHMVAAKLYSLALPDSSEPSAVPATKRMQTTISKAPAKMTSKASAKVQEIQANLDFLSARTAEELRHWLALQCDSNPLLAQQLSLWRSQTQDLPQTSAQWKRYLTQAMPQRRDMWGRELQRWVDHAQEALQPLQQQIPVQPANILAAAEVAMRRLFKIWETCDDSNGEGQDLYGQLQDLIYDSVAAQSPPASWLNDWLQLMEDDPLSIWDEPRLLALAGEPLRHAYACKAAQEWQAIHTTPMPAPKHRHSNRGNTWEQEQKRQKWRKRYVWSLQQELSTADWLQAMQKITASESEWIELVQACERHQQPRLALQYAQQGLQFFKNSDPLQQLLLQCYRRDGWDKEAYQLALHLLRHQPSETKRLKTALDCAETCGLDRESVFQTLLQESIHTALPAYGQKQGKDIHIALIWLQHEDRWKQALELLEQPRYCCSWESLKKQLALRLPESHHPQAVQLLQSLLTQKMEKASSPYQEELQLVKQVSARLASSDRPQWLEFLRKIYGRKINFIRGLDAISEKTMINR